MPNRQALPIEDLHPLIRVARLLGPFGVKGQIRLRSLTMPDDACFSYGHLYDAHRNILVTPGLHRRRRDRVFIVTPQENRSREDWIALAGLDLFTSIDRLAPLAEGEIYAASLIGCSIEHCDGRKLGTVRDVHDFGAGDILDIVCGGSSYYLPFTDETACNIRLENQRIVSRCQDHWLPARLRKTSPRS